MEDGPGGAEGPGGASRRDEWAQEDLKMRSIRKTETPGKLLSMMLTSDTAGK